MRIFNSLIVPKNVKEGIRLFQYPFRCKTPKNRMGDPLKTLKNFEEQSHKAEKGAGKVS